MDFNRAINDFNMNDPISIMIAIVGILIVIMSFIGIVVSIRLAISYVKYNKKENSLRLTGDKVARKILDNNDLKNIEVKTSGSIMFGNSYSHYFKKVRLRRRTIKKPSVASLAMGAQKSCLAILDKENDPDMLKRIRLTPIIVLGPLAFIPLVIIGILLDVLINNVIGTFSITFAALGLAFYILSFIMSILVLKTEKKAQAMALEILVKDKMATNEELDDLKKLFHLYNIEYVNDMIMSMLEMIYYALRIFQMANGNASSMKSK